MPITVSGTSITFNDSTTQTTAGITSAVTSAVAGNGIAVSGATGAVTFSAACPTFNSVGSYTWGVMQRAAGSPQSYTAGTNYSAGSGNMQMQTGAYDTNVGWAVGNQLSGTWKWMAASGTLGGNLDYIYGLACRVS